MFTKSRHVPGVKYAGLIHTGLIGCLPSRKMLDMWNAREKVLFDTEPDRVPHLAALPTTQSAHMGAMAAAAEAARTVPPREHGGNCDIKDLSRGATSIPEEDNALLRLLLPRLRHQRAPSVDHRAETLGR